MILPDRDIIDRCVNQQLRDGQIWHYHDARTWGKWWMKTMESIEEDPYFESYGPDWLHNPQAAKRMLTEVRESSRKIKDVLCDQRVTAGLGNYLSCEALHRAFVHPHSKTNLLGREDMLRLTEGIETVLRESMKSSDHRAHA